MMRFKNLVSLLLVFMLCVSILPGQVAFANKYSEYETVELIDTSTGLAGVYEPLGLMIRGVDVLSDTPGISVNGRSLIPIASVFNELDIPVQWVGSTREIIFNSNGKKVVLQIDNPIALVNGVKTELPNGVAPKIFMYKGTDGAYVSRTYVPVAFVTGMLDLSVSWIEATRTVAINRKAQSLSGVDLFWRLTPSRPDPEIRLKVTGEVDATSFVVKGLDVGGKDKTIIELQNTQFAVSDSSNVKNGQYTYTISDGIYGLDRVLVEQTSTNPHTTRVTIFQDERRGHDISYDGKTGEMVIRLINTVDNISVQEIFGTEAIVIESSENPNINTEVSGNNVYVDIIGSVLHYNDSMSETVLVNKGKVKTVSYKQLSSEVYGMDAVRMTVALDKEADYDDYFAEPDGNKTIVYIPREKINNIQYVKSTNIKSSLFVDLIEPKTVFSYDFDASLNQLKIQVPKSATALDAYQYMTKDSVVEKITVSESGEFYNVDVVFTQQIEYNLIKNNNAIVFEFTNKTIQQSDYTGKLVVIDAGHGGDDPGAVGTLVQEKSIVLKSAILLQKELESRGFKVYMTRSKDEYVNLYDRASMANGLNATVFVSIHANAHTGAQANGVEVLYSDESMASDKGLAMLVQNELVGALGATNRGVVSRPKLVVLRETTMPAILVELGFISNATEQAKLMDDNYLKKAAIAMANGISDFID